MRKITNLAKILSISTLFFLTGCIGNIAQQVVQTRNFGKTADQLGMYTPEQMKLGQFDHQARIEVGPETAPASLHLTVIEPKQQWTLTPDSHLYKLFAARTSKKDPSAQLPKTLYWSPTKLTDPTYVSNFHFTPEPPKTNFWTTPKGTIILLHGLNINKNMYTTNWAQILPVYGYRTVLVDLRGHGLSTGNYLTFGRTESKDITHVIDYLQANNMLTNPLIVMGVSYGAATAIQTGALDSRVTAVISMEPFASFKTVAYDFTKTTNPKLARLAGPLGVSLVIKEAAKIAHFDLDTNTTLDAARTLNQPLLLIHGQNDQHIPCVHSKQLHDAAPNSTLLITPNAHHMNLMLYHPYQLRDTLINWLNTLPSPQSSS